MSITQLSQLCNGKKHRAMATGIVVVMGVGWCLGLSHFRILTDILASYFIHWLLRKLKETVRDY